MLKSNFQLKFQFSWLRLQWNLSWGASRVWSGVLCERKLIFQLPIHSKREYSHTSCLVWCTISAENSILLPKDEYYWDVHSLTFIDIISLKFHLKMSPRWDYGWKFEWIRKSDQWNHFKVLSGGPPFHQVQVWYHHHHHYHHHSDTCCFKLISKFR